MRIPDGAKILSDPEDSQASLYGTLLSLNDQFVGNRKASTLGSNLRV